LFLIFLPKNLSQAKGFGFAGAFETEVPGNSQAVSNMNSQSMQKTSDIVQLLFWAGAFVYLFSSNYHQHGQS